MLSSSEFKLPLAVMRDEIATADLLPPIYARYRRLLADGLCFFLERLRPVRLRAIFAEQGRMPAAASVAQRLVSLLRHIPTLHKLGQVVARDRRLSRDFRDRLQQLESLETRTTATECARLLSREFKNWKKAGIKLGESALAEGSVAVVMPFVWQNDPEGGECDGVFKLLKPGVEDRLEEELAIWSELGDFLEEHCAHYHLPVLDYHGTFEMVRDLLLHEVRLDEEQKHLAEAAKEYVGIGKVVIPMLLPFGSPRLTVMERLDGVTLCDRLRQTASSTRGLGQVIASALMASPIFSKNSAALFHGDPHAGNLFITNKGQLGILDWSLAGRLLKEDRIEFVQLFIGALTLDGERISRTLDRLATDSVNPATVKEVIERSLRDLRWGTRPGIGWLLRLLDALVTEAKVRLKPEFLLLRKSLLTLDGVLGDVTGGEARTSEAFLDQALMSGLAGQLAAEWPVRFQKSVDSRAFRTHLSTDDLLSLFCCGPGTAARYWIGAWSDLLCEFKL